MTLYLSSSLYQKGQPVPVLDSMTASLSSFRHYSSFSSHLPTAMKPSWLMSCKSCGSNWPSTSKHLESNQGRCLQCDSTWLEPIFNYAMLGQQLPSLLTHRRHTMWRYRELLPLHDDEHCVTLGEGGTPLLHLKNLGLMLGCPNLYLKDERQGPTGSFKDRQASLAISVMKEQGIQEAVVASTGNVAIAYSAYATRAGIKLWAFLTSEVPPDKMREVALYGTEVVKVTATYDRTKQIAAQFAKRKNLHLDRGIRSMAARESMKTLAYEIAEDLGERQGQTAQKRWQAPDWYIQAVSGGMGPVGVLKGFEELKALGFTTHVPKLASIQAAGCAPMVHAWQADSPTPFVVDNPQTRIATVATGAPGIAYEMLYQGAKRYGGTFAAIPDEEAFRAMHILAKMDGISMEPAAALACAGAIELLRSGTIKPHETIVICCSGHTFPVEKHLLDENWAHDIHLSEEEKHSSIFSENLFTSLENLGRDVKQIAIIEDDPQATVLLRRILQTQGNYEIFEAPDGRRGLQLIRQKKPDLVLLDLMMPEMDGFTVIDELKRDPIFQNLPIIVITAAHLNPAEKARLQSQVSSLLRKGNFVERDLVNDINAALVLNRHT